MAHAATKYRYKSLKEYVNKYEWNNTQNFSSMQKNALSERKTNQG